MKRFILALIHGYQKWISPLLGTNCRFYPSCSEYTIKALEDHGLFKGLWLGGTRILRCHPLADGGVDPVPPANEPPLHEK